MVTSKKLTGSTDEPEASESAALWVSPVLSLAAAKSLFGFSGDEEARHALAFLDSIGLIVYKGRTGDDSDPSHVGRSKLDDIVLLRPQVVTDALQRLITPTVPSLVDTRTLLESMASWCERCGRAPTVWFSKKLKLKQCSFCTRWYCKDHVSAHSVHDATVLACEVCTPLVATYRTTDATRSGAVTVPVDVIGLKSTGRLSRALRESLWSVYPVSLRKALKALLLELKFLCRAPTTVTAAADEPPASKSADLFVPCVFVQCPFIGRQLPTSSIGARFGGGAARVWWIDVALRPAGLWSDVMGCLSSVSPRWQPERSPDRKDNAASDHNVEHFVDCGTIVRLLSDKPLREIGCEEVRVRLECRRSTLTSVVESRIVVSGWYNLEGGGCDCGTMEGRQWRLMAGALQCIHERLLQHAVLTKLHTPQVTAPASLLQVLRSY